MDTDTAATSTASSDAVPAHRFPSLIERYYTQRYAVGTIRNTSVYPLGVPKKSISLTLISVALSDTNGSNEDVYVYIHTNGYD